MKKLVFNSICLFALMFSFQFSWAQSDSDYDIQGSFDQIQQQLEHMMQELGQGDGNNFFFSDTLFNQGFGGMPMEMDSLMQGFSFVFPPSFGNDSLSMGQDPFLDNGMQDQLDLLFRSLDDLDPQYFQGLEEMMRQFDQNGIRPDGDQRPPTKKGQVKKKIYKI